MTLPFFRFAGVILLVVLLTTGCATSRSPGTEGAGFILQISKPDSTGTSYKNYKTVKDTAKANEIRNILIKADTSNAQVSMSRSADRKIEVANANDSGSEESREYGIWFSPDKSHVEIVSEPTGGYIQLDADNSKKILSVLK